MYGAHLVPVGRLPALPVGAPHRVSPLQVSPVHFIVGRRQSLDDDDDDDDRRRYYYNFKLHARSETGTAAEMFHRKWLLRWSSSRLVAAIRTRPIDEPLHIGPIQTPAGRPMQISAQPLGLLVSALAGAGGPGQTIMQPKCICLSL